MHCRRQASSPPPNVKLQSSTEIPSRATYSHVGIIIGAVVSELFGMYVLVPDGDLRTFDDWLSIWQPVVWDAPAVVLPPSFQKEEASRLSLWLRSEGEEEEAMDEKQIQDISAEDFTEKPRALSGPFRPEIEPPIPPQVKPDHLPRMLPFHKGVVLIFVLCQQFALFVLPCLIRLALVQETYALRKMRKVYEAEKRKNADLLKELKGKDARGDSTKAQRDDQAKNELVDEGCSGLPDAECLLAKKSGLHICGRNLGALQWWTGG